MNVYFRRYLSACKRTQFDIEQHNLHSIVWHRHHHRQRWLSHMIIVNFFRSENQQQQQQHRIVIPEWRERMRYLYARQIANRYSPNPFFWFFGFLFVFFFPINRTNDILPLHWIIHAFDRHIQHLETRFITIDDGVSIDSSRWWWSTRCRNQWQCLKKTSSKTMKKKL